MLSKLLLAEATHSSLDLFEKAPLLVSFDGPSEQRIGPSYTPSGPIIEFEVVGDRNYFLDTTRIYLEVTWKIKRSDGNNLAAAATGPPAVEADRPFYVNNALHSLFSDCNIFANGTKVCSSNGLYAQ